MKSEVTTLWRFTNMLIIVAVVIIIIITLPSKSVNPCVGTTSNIYQIFRTTFRLTVMSSAFIKRLPKYAVGSFSGFVFFCFSARHHHHHQNLERARRTSSSCNSVVTSSFRILRTRKLITSLIRCNSRSRPDRNDSSSGIEYKAGGWLAASDK